MILSKKQKDKKIFRAREWQNGFCFGYRGFVFGLAHLYSNVWISRRGTSDHLSPEFLKQNEEHK